MDELKAEGSEYDGLSRRPSRRGSVGSAGSGGVKSPGGTSKLNLDALREEAKKREEKGESSEAVVVGIEVEGATPAATPAAE
jgi:hypothetical protein